MPLWTYDKAPQMPQHTPPGSYIASTEEGWVLFKPNGSTEILVAIGKFNEKHDVGAQNLDLEGGDDFILEDDSAGECFIILE